MVDDSELLLWQILRAIALLNSNRLSTMMTNGRGVQDAFVRQYEMFDCPTAAVKLDSLRQRIESVVRSSFMFWHGIVPFCNNDRPAPYAGRVHRR